MKFKVGDIVISKLNRLTKYKVTKVNKESIDVIALDIAPNTRYNGVEFDLFYKEKK